MENEVFIEESEYTVEEYMLLKEFLDKELLPSEVWKNDSLYGLILDGQYVDKKVKEFIEPQKWNRSNNIFIDIYTILYYIPFEDVPLYINDTNTSIRTVAKWRLSLGK